MTQVPAVLARLPALTRLGLRSNGLEAIRGAALPPNLVHVIFTDNAIAAIDDAAYAKFASVRKLMLANNRLQSFTGGADPVANLRSLELLRLANNQLEGLPEAVLKAPRLAWLALAGNPLVGKPPAGGVPAVSFADIDFAGAVALGKGASGAVRSASLKGVACAVKELQEKSSDGTAADELSVHRALGDPARWPASLIRTLAVVEAPPAVVMERLDARAHDLAKPPTIVEVTRDRYAPGERYSAALALDVSRGLAEALAHLHANGVAHGDVYAHNTLIVGGGAKLGDFGAATYYGALPAATQRLLERVEVRAFGVLMAELATRIAGDPAARDALLGVSEAALGAEPAARPAFAELVKRLGALGPSRKELK
mmetsp:Transcript_7993/g.23837  ORF Transcript_7993/g.23837 Transcript_7993/m.23837 type:complete len:370 (-) Transcript_7993:29-1138(-)